MHPLDQAALTLYGGTQNRKAYHRSKKLMNYQLGKDKEMWDYQNAYNTPANQMRRLKAAGLNPALMYGQGTTGNATNAPQSKFTELKPFMGAADIAQSTAAGAQISLVNAQKDLLKSQALSNMSKSGLDDANKFKIQSLLGLEMDKMKSDIEFTKANTSLTRVTSVLNSAKIGLTLDQRKQVQAQVEQVFKNIEVQDKMLEMDYSDAVGKNWMTTAERLFSGQFDNETKLGAASTLAALALLKDPTKARAVAAGATAMVSALYDKFKNWYKKKFN